MSNILKNNYDEVVSLGFNCFPKRYISTYITKAPHKYFDYVGSSCWSILELLKNNFENLDCIEQMTVLKNKNIHTNTKYYIRHMHDSFSGNVKENTLKSITNRSDRFKELLQTNKKVVFIRLQESIKNRIIYHEYKTYYEKSEEEYLKEISNWLKLHTSLFFKIIYLNDEKEYYDDSTNILYVKDDIEKYDWNNCSDLINIAIQKSIHINDF